VGLEGRVALVTGGGRGIGRAIALALAADGADIAVNYRRDDEAAAATVKELAAFGRRAIAYRASVESLDDDRAMVDSITADLGPIDILVNNAGIASRGRSVVDTDPEEPVRVVGTHTFGAFYLCHLVLPGMRTRTRGDIVMISSAATHLLSANGAPYNMAKASLEALAFTLAKEERSHGVRVNIVAPGLVETEMGRRLMKGAAGIDDLRTLDAVMPYGHVCQPDDVAGVVRFLVSDRAGYVNGQRIYVDGGGP
jgi:NAD(P)-dependent dehydrogenase (short-subunit alcohol dehydrogenase family)